MSISSFETVGGTASLQFGFYDATAPITERLYQNSFISGANYGNRFIPEPWMATESESIYHSKYGPEIKKPDYVSDWSFCDIEDDRILRYLDDKVKEEHFQKLQQWGVKTLRVPTGYWNWIELGNLTPNAPDRVAARFKNLQKVTPDQYAPYIDKIFTWAKKYGMKVFVEMHGAPGSQNGEMHSGCITATQYDSVKPEHYFDTDWNMQLGVRTVEKMAEKCNEFIDSCYGVGVLNEPQPGNPTPSEDTLHKFLDKYFGEAILAARKHLDHDVPVALFSWTYDFWRWSDRHFPEEQYGNIIWDTHLYTPDADSVDEALHNYESDLQKIEDFQKKQNQDILVGEFALSNLHMPTDHDHTSNWQRYADSVFPKMQEKANAGALLWNFDCQYGGWSMSKLESEAGVEWKLNK